jgi:putative CocE/NonD family hydrolase
VYDPHHPAPTLSGRNLVPGGEGGFVIGPVDQRMTDQRTDILRFVTEPLTEEVEVTGDLFVTIHAATEAVDTDWTAMLIDVWPDGRAFNVSDGIIRARHRSGNDQSILLPANEPHDFVIDLAATSQAFLPGHRIRVDISSSNFPRFDRNPGTGALSTDVTEDTFVTQHQTLFLDSARPSYITLPIIPT